MPAADGWRARDREGTTQPRRTSETQPVDLEHGNNRGRERIQTMDITRPNRSFPTGLLFHGMTQMALAMMIVASVPITVIFAWVTLWSGRSYTDIKDLTLGLLTALSGLSGAVLGYYYGRREAEGERVPLPATTKRKSRGTSAKAHR
jgi:hypothetical protein